MARIGVDVGGTFTDLVLWDEAAGTLAVHKVPSTPHDPSIAALAGIQALCARAEVPPSRVRTVIHGTTVATNTVLERSGAKVGLITTRGFRDLLHIARKKRPFNFSNYLDVPWQAWPLVPRRHRLAVRERVTAPAGAVETPLAEDEVREAVIRLRDEGVEAVAICFLFSFLNPAHEARAAEIVREVHPGAFLSVSHEVVPLFREYERCATTAVNAYVGPKVATYVRRFADGLRALGVSCELHLMTSAGGVVTAAGAADKPASLLLSGPVGAALAGIRVGETIGAPSVITLDVGGTSADIAVAPDGRLRSKHLLDTKVGGYDAMLPMVDIDTIGAGGGSIAGVDEGGMFRVGPHSAGAVPGPACYGRGGTRATATDAAVVLGWLQPEHALPGHIRVRGDLARDAIARDVAAPLRLSVEDAALGVVRVLTHNMVDAIGVNSIRKGYDPRDFALVALGGAGPLFAAEIARQLSIPRVIVPPHPGIGAATGLLTTDVKYDYLATLWEPLPGADRARIARAYHEMTERARRRLAADGFGEGETEIQWRAECRYAGQGYELLVDAPVGSIDDAWIATVTERFHQAHERTYLRRFEDRDVHVINAGVAGVGKITAPRESPIPAAYDGPAALVATVEALFPGAAGGARHATRVYFRDWLTADTVLEGPAIIEQLDTTIVIPPGDVAVVHPLGHLILRVGGAR